MPFTVNRDFDAFVYDSVVLQYLSGIDNTCEIGTVGKWFSWTGYGIGFPKKSKWLNQVNKRILKYQENGKNNYFDEIKIPFSVQTVFFALKES